MDWTSIRTNTGLTMLRASRRFPPHAPARLPPHAPARSSHSFHLTDKLTLVPPYRQAYTHSTHMPCRLADSLLFHRVGDLTAFTLERQAYTLPTVQASHRGLAMSTPVGQDLHSNCPTARMRISRATRLQADHLLPRSYVGCLCSWSCAVAQVSPRARRLAP